MTNFHIVLFNSWRTTSLNALVFNGKVCSLVSTESPTAAQERLRLSEIHVHWRIFTLGEWISSLHAEKMPNNAGEWRGGVASSVSVFVFHHTSSVWINDSVDKANSLTPSALIHPYTRALLPLNVTGGTKHFSLYSSSSNNRHFRCFWIWNDWLGLLRPAYGFQEVSIL